MPQVEAINFVLRIHAHVFFISFFFLLLSVANSLVKMLSKQSQTAVRLLLSTQSQSWNAPLVSPPDREMCNSQRGARMEERILRLGKSVRTLARPLRM